MNSYHFEKIEDKWQKYWAENKTFNAQNESDKPKYYVLDMFPYPSGAGLHVGHPLGYIASDIYARYKRHQGYNVLHPQGYDSFGLPAEQYAIQTGQHPAITTKTNIETYRKQLDKIGFSFDWSREVRTSSPEYYKWTQWIFIQLFNSWYNKTTNKAEVITELVHVFEKEGNTNVQAECDSDIKQFTSSEWLAFSDKKKETILLGYRLTYLSDTEVNWCPALGTVLANDEIINGLSERGGHPVVRKKMTQWSMRITAYAQRLLDDLNTIDWPQPLKDSQTNWIGRSQGAMVRFSIANHDEQIEVFTTRPDTIFGVSFVTLAPEHELVQKIVTSSQKEAVEAYVQATSKRSERERMADVKAISGVFTGAYALHPFSGEKVPIWIGDYVLASYGTGAVMAVPCGDQRDYDFAKHFELPIPNIFENVDISEAAFADKEGVLLANSDFLNGLSYKKAFKTAVYNLEQRELGYGKTNYRLRDAVFSRQRYWGEPFPVYYKDGVPKMIASEHLPIVLPEVEKYLPTETGEPPLGRATKWAWDTSLNKVVLNETIDHKTIFPLELNTMPGWAGSSWYFFRYMDAHNTSDFASEKALKYWENVDLYIGGSEHATGHLLYARFWVKFLKDRGFVNVSEPFKKLINQGMILGESAFVFEAVLDNKSLNVFASSEFFKETSFYDSNDDKNGAINKALLEKGIHEDELPRISFRQIHADVSMVNVSNELDTDAFSSWRPEFDNAIFVKGSEGVFKVSREVEKMSKSKFNVINPDDICAQFGADTLRMYEMFLGPLEQAKPWSTAGMTGVHSFLKKLWRLYHSGPEGSFNVVDDKASKENLKTLHKTIKKVVEDIENFSFNTSVSTFMIAVNELSAQKCVAKEVLEPLAILIAPYAPHIAEELWEKLGNKESVSWATYPKFEEKHLVESVKKYPISFNGKMRFTLELPLDMSKDEIEAVVMSHEKTKHYLEGRSPKKVIIVPGKIVNIVG